ncbi:lipid-A-disaccharide synthase [Candidatus Halocynthiibacter alkanivorans]|uniref:lipid-A-disaccharide synthase n=1 Tax=Candidatus Halocynthiibacter alkanivorans TaxID=2267619 RepID=UPI000DF42864|nr:lipid-A-disaccharide synthase [Candidatus Halocynthiibacter alkanivorans]
MKFFLIAGELSGDRLGAALMAGLKQLLTEVNFAGVGGPLMQAEGLTSQFPMDELSVMGIAEVLPKYFHLKRRIAETSQACIDFAPDAMITIDSPDFCLRVAKMVRATSRVRTVHYVAPSVWAWRPKRAEKMAHSVDQVLALLPFEPPYMEKAGMRCDFVGHPVVSEPVADAAQVAEFRQEHGIGDAPLLLTLPGSRRSEVTRLCPIFGAALKTVVKHRPDARVVLPAAPNVAALVAELTAEWPVSPIILNPSDMALEQGLMQKRAAFAAADVALAASGTVSLELAAAGTPMVIGYDMSWLSWQIMDRMRMIDTVTLVNLVSETRHVAEFLGPKCVPGEIGAALCALLDDGDAQENQRQAMAVTMQRLGLGAEAPGLRAARAVLDGLS